jgi:hypothetical protein
MLRALRRLLPCVFAPLLFVACAESGAGTNAPPVDAPVADSEPADAAPVDSGPDTTPASVDTEAPARVRAGEVVAARCVVRNRAGEVIAAAPPTTVAFEPATAVRMDGARVIASRVGTVTARCALADAPLRDETPASIEIAAGPAARVTTTLDRADIAAGETATATCAVVDAEGNAVTDAPATIATTPMGDGVRVTAMAIAPTRAGAYMVSCRVTGATGEPATLTVSPALPATLRIARAPDQAVYRVDDDIRIDTVVEDRFGNRVASPMLAYESAPMGGLMDRPAVYRYPLEGRFTVTVRVAGPTEGGVTLSESTSFVVDSSGPQVTCAGDATMVDLAPGAPLAVRGTLRDTSGVQAVRVGGTMVPVAEDGTFAGTVTSRFGMNFVEVRATDALGMENARTCVFLVSNRWQPEAGLLGSGVSLQLAQAAIDDGDPVSPITSLDDILQTVLNSPGLSDQLDASLRAANPLKDSCDQEVCVFGRCTCVFRSSVNYDGREFAGPNTTSVTLVDGGVRARVRLENLGIRLRIGGTLSTSGWVRFANIDVDLIFDLSAPGGAPRATVRPGSVSVNVGGIRTEFGGITGTIVNVVASLANGLVRDLVSRLVRDYIQSNFNAVLTGLVGGLNVSSLGASFNVPRLDGMGSVALGFGLGISALDATPARLFGGIGTRFTAMATRATASRGVALQPAAAEPARRTPATVIVQPGVLNQALHALWRGGFFDASLDATSFGEFFTAGSTITLSTALPPVASIGDDGRVRLDLGALTATLNLTGAPPVRASLGARATTTAALMGNDIRFAGVRLDELYVGFDDTSMSSMERETLAAALRMILQTLVDRSLNDALPAIPIPSFVIPDSLRMYGLPAGRELGITAPALALEQGVFVLRGGFGVR